MSDEPDRQDLEERVEQLESTITKMLPGRRDALKLGGAALVGGAAMSGTASAGDESEGTIGTATDPVDVESEDINNADTVTTQDLVVNGTATGPFGSDLQACRVNLTSNQTGSAGSTTKIQFDNKVYDNGNNFDTNTHEWTCPTTGMYYVNANVKCSGGNKPDERDLFIGSGGNIVVNNVGSGFRVGSATSFFDVLQSSNLSKYSQGETISAYFRNFDSDGEIDSGTANNDSFMEVVFLGTL